MTNLHSSYRKHMEEEMRGEDFQVLKERILMASREKRAEESLRAASRKRRVLRSAVACTCAVAVVVGSVFAYDAAKRNGAAMTSGSDGNGLCLSAYAAGTKGSVTPAVPAKDAADVRGFNFNAAERITDFGHRRVLEDFTFDFSCRGKNIKTLKYEISGGTEFAVSGKDTNSSDGNPYKYLPKEKTFLSFIAKPGDDLSRYRIRAEASVTAEEEATLKAEKDGTLYSREEAAKLKARANAGEDMSGMLSPCHTIAEVKINDVLNGTVISVTAAFADGTAKTARYQLSAVKDYLGTLRAFYKAGEQLEKTYYTKNGLDKSREKEYEDKRIELDRNTKFYCITELKK